MAELLTLRKFEALSPFEIKNELIKLAKERRVCFFLCGEVAMTESERVMDQPPGIGGMPQAKGIASRLEAWLAKHADMPGAAFLSSMVPFAINTFAFEPDAFVHELVDSIIGDNYPVPDRMLVHNERIVHAYLMWAMCGQPHPTGKIDLYAVEGGTAAMCYIFKSLTIAAPQENRFQYTDEEIQKLEDPKVKAFFIVNPGNPTGMGMSRETIAKIVNLVKTKRPDLMLLTDDVYGTFVEDFRSLLGELPRNTIGVYSYSKYFGCTGWRLGVIAIHQDNIFDEMIAKLPAEHVTALDKRYGPITLEPRKLKFIDRIVADSRDIGLNHTAGLSLPQQVMMTMFSLYELMDEKKAYQKACMEIVNRRAWSMIESLGLQLTPNPNYDAYYGLIDFEFWARKNIGDEAVEYLKKNVHPLDLAFRLAEDHGIVLLNGGGFEAPQWSLRVSLANLPDEAYEEIGRGVRTIARGYRQAFEAHEAGKNGGSAKAASKTP